MTASNRPDVASAWRRFLMDRELARGYPIAFSLDGGAPLRNVVLDELLPSLLHIKAVAILDLTLVDYLEVQELRPPKQAYRNSLDGRIKFLADNGRLPNDARLHTVRLLRNDLAHEVSDVISWDALEGDVDVIEGTLQHLGYVGARPKFEVYGERSALRDAPEPNVLGVMDFTFGVRENGTWAAVIRWSKKLLRAGA